jgi:hypothetical protein
MNPIDVHSRLNDDFEFFAEHAPLVIQTKVGELAPLKLNIAQRFLHEKMKEQEKKKGWIRIIIVKGRQAGISTFLEGWSYHRVARRTGVSASILTHDATATDNLFGMVRRYHANVNPALKPAIDKDNPRQMTFPGLNAKYTAATAGNEDAGRSMTAQIVHWSEVAYCENAAAILDSMLQGVALLPGTAIILESTANGPKGLYFEMCQAAMRGEGDYQFVFLPWYWQEEYERADDGSKLTEKEEKFIAEHFSNPFPFSLLPISHAKARRKMLWRRGKVFELSPLNPQIGEAKFCAVYPSNPIEAFLSTALGEIRADAIVTARSLDRKLALDEMFARVAGLDPAGEGKRADRSILAIRQGNVFEKAYRFAGLNSMQLVGRIARLLEEERLDKLFVDNGYGKQIVDRLHELGFKNRVIGVWFGQGSDFPNKYTNKRSEIHLLGADWVNAGGVSIPDSAEIQLDANAWLCGGHEIHADLAALPMHKESSEGKHSIAPREDLIKLFGQSLDIFAAFGLTFSLPVHRVDPTGGGRNTWRNSASSATISQQNGNVSRGGLKSLNRKRELR